MSAVIFEAAVNPTGLLYAADGDEPVLLAALIESMLDGTEGMARLYATQTTINFAGAKSGPANSPLYARAFVFGQVDDEINGAEAAIARLQFTDTATAIGASGRLNGLLVRLGTGAGALGPRSAIQGYMAVTGQSAGSLSLYVASVAVQGIATSNATQGGTGVGTIPTNYRGNSFGGNFNSSLVAGATFYGLLCGVEIDATIAAGASAYHKYGLLIVKSLVDAVRGDGDDAAISISDQDGAAATWKRGIAFGSTTSLWPFGADSTIIGAMQRVYPAPDAPIALNGVDFREVAFQSGGFAFASNGFSVDPNGEIQFGTFAADASASVAGTITITDAAGDARKLMVAT